MFESVENYPVQINSLSIIVRMLDGLGYRFRYATEGLNKTDYQFIPKNGVNSIEEEQELADYFCNKVKVKMDKIREDIDTLETIVDDELWPLPKFWEILFIN